ncbi:hypothetical protein [Flammeovirga sp. EKP202]|uniref:hypothetical protein n=1 Tax=Flammeovirga sp. EKP202 TaxID=2770592 RepID=UPI00165FCFCA|nr:hypothetical protein [Flammeovirga sp. EKP202]MBD0403238.1 hypothetical protein [Flammeovirga sp. EKP202]
MVKVNSERYEEVLETLNENNVPFETVLNVTYGEGYYTYHIEAGIPVTQRSCLAKHYPETNEFLINEELIDSLIE